MKATRKIAKVRAPQKSKDLEATANDYEKLFLKMEREKKPVLPKDFFRDVDKTLQTDWVRRAALRFLEMPFKEMTDCCGKDRNTAVAFADLSSRMPDAIKRYQGLVDILNAAQLRIGMALCVREDMPAVLKEARHEN
jgi:hypothetical protein